MASRKRLYTNKTLNVIDVASKNAIQASGILHILQEQLKTHLDGNEALQDVDAVMWALIDLMGQIKKATNELDREGIVYEDTLEDYLAEVKVEAEQQLNS